MFTNDNDPLFVARLDQTAVPRDDTLSLIMKVLDVGWPPRDLAAISVLTSTEGTPKPNRNQVNSQKISP